MGLCGSEVLGLGPLPSCLLWGPPSGKDSMTPQLWALM